MSVRMLRECGEIAALRLSGALADALKRAADRLFLEATKADGFREREFLLDAAELARVRRRGLVADFGRDFERRYERACRRRPGFLSAMEIDFDPSQLKIVEHDLLEDTLDAGMIAETIQNACWETLYDLGKWYGILLDLRDLNPNDMPLAPKLIAAAVSGVLREQPWRHEAKALLARTLCRYLPDRVSLLYRDLLGHLVAGDLERSESENWPGDARSPGSEVREGGPSGSPPEAPVEAPAEPRGAVSAEGPGPARDDEAAALAAAHQEVSRCMAATTLPDFVVELLTGQWQALLAGIHREVGAGSRAWADAVQTMDELAWSVTPKSSRADHVRLVEGMSGLMRRLDLGLGTLGCSYETRTRFFFGLTEYEAKIVAESLAREAAAQATPAPSAPPREGVPGAAPEPAAQPEPAASVPPPEPGPPANPLEDLASGVWMELQEEDGSTREVKLAWISPRKSIYLLTNRQGRRALSLTAEELAAMLLEGRARVVDVAPGTANPAAGAGAEPGYKKSA
jgi:Protein of unknown function (DUF1631)